MRKMLFVLIALIATMLCGSAIASSNFDVSVFQNNDKYDVIYDDMDDTVEITMRDGVSVMAVFDEDDGMVLGSIDIKGIEGWPPVIRITMLYAGDDWIFTDKVILKPIDIRYTFEVNRDTDVEGGKIYEQYTLIITNKSIGLLEDVVAGNTIVKMRLDGDRELNGNLLFLGDIEALYNDYVTAGGLKGDFSSIDIVFPCEVKAVP